MLDEFGAPLAGVEPIDFATPGTSYTAGLPPVRFDILTQVKGATFKEMYANRTKVMIGCVPVFYVSLEGLIKIKRATGRPQDKIDVELLKKFKGRSRGK